jgi:hypothetical protein
MTAQLQDPPPDLRVLRAELAELRRTHPPRSTVVRVAFERLFRASFQLGQPLSGLRRHTTNEVERFFAHTIPGPDGHVYWDGPQTFTRNDGKTRIPRRWWWAHKHGRELGQHEDLIPTCGQSSCVNPDHCEIGRGLRRLRFDREAMLGALRVGALRLGHAPNWAEWDTLGLSPSQPTYKLRFGSWGKALREAGLTPGRGSQYAPTTPASCLEALRLVHKTLGRWPSRKDFEDSRQVLITAGLPSSSSTIKKYLGPWTEALRKAGRR